MYTVVLVWQRVWINAIQCDEIYLRFDCASKSRLFVCENSDFFFTANGGFYAIKINCLLFSAFYTKHDCLYESCSCHFHRFHLFNEEIEENKMWQHSNGPSIPLALQFSNRPVVMSLESVPVPPTASQLSLLLLLKEQALMATKLCPIRFFPVSEPFDC